jgi:hypothetical protein
MSASFSVVGVPANLFGFETGLAKTRILKKPNNFKKTS